MLGETNGSIGAADLAAVLGNNGNGFGGNNAWWIILFLIFMNGGWGNGNCGGNNGSVQRGFDQTAIMSGLQNIQNGLAAGKGHIAAGDVNHHHGEHRADPDKIQSRVPVPLPHQSDPFPCRTSCTNPSAGRSSGINSSATGTPGTNLFAARIPPAHKSVCGANLPAQVCLRRVRVWKRKKSPRLLPETG